MGVIYKLQPETKNFILEKKKESPDLSCRALKALIEEELKIKVSKSSVNAVFKEAGLSLPVGRRYKGGKRRPEKSRVMGLLTLKLGMGTVLAESHPTSIVENRPHPPIVQTEPPVPEPITESIPEPAPEPVIPEPPKPIIVQTTPPVPEPIPEPPQEIPLEPIPEPLPEKVAVRQLSLRGSEATEANSKFASSPSAPRNDETGEGQTTGAILLKAADYLNGGVYRLAETIRTKLRVYSPDIVAKTEALLYSRLFDQPDMSLWTLINYQLTPEGITAYHNELQEVIKLEKGDVSVFSTGVPSEKTETSPFSQAVLTLFRDIRGIKVVLSDGTYFYLDGQLRSIWSTPQIPHDFSANLYKIKGYLGKYFHDHDPFVLFTPPGYEIPTNEFFEFILSFNSPEKKRISLLALYGSKFEELDVFKIEQFKRQYFVFGLWPWQFVQYRKVNKLGEFRQFHFAPLNKDFYLADVEMELLQPKTNEGVTLRGAALKTTLIEKTRLIILSNLPAEKAGAEEVSRIYLNHWPYPEEAFQDHSRKIELFTYTAGSQHAFAQERLSEKLEDEKLGDGSLREPSPIDSLFAGYLKLLDLYARLYFMPSGYENKDFPVMKEQFYNLLVSLREEKDYTLATFRPPKLYPWLKDLEYALRRLNEHEVTSPDGRRLWFKIGTAIF